MINIKTIFFKPVRHVSHFSLILTIIIVLLSGIKAPESMTQANIPDADPLRITQILEKQSEEEIDITEMEVVAFVASYFDTEMANEIYELIGNSQQESSILLAGRSIANPSYIDTESSAKLEKKWEKYIVQSGDTLSTIAAKFGVSTNSIKWSNSKIKDIDFIKPGMTLYIPTVTGIIHKVKSGDTVELLAAKYKSNASLIIAYNDLYGEGLKVGESILIPNGRKEEPKPTTTTRVASAGYSTSRYGSSSYIARTGSFRFPTIIGRNGYYNGYHWWAIDIPNSIGTPIYAADSGRIIEARYGWNGGYGNTILIDHGDGFQTRYAHLSTIKIFGGYVSKGQVIGYMGSTGRSTGSHLHFEIIRNGARQNPIYYFR